MLGDECDDRQDDGALPMLWYRVLILAMLTLIIVALLNRGAK